MAAFFDVSLVLEVVPCTDMLYNSCMGPKGVDMHFLGKLGLKIDPASGLSVRPQLLACNDYDDDNDDIPFCLCNRQA